MIRHVERLTKLLTERLDLESVPDPDWTDRAAMDLSREFERHRRYQSAKTRELLKAIEAFCRLRKASLCGTENHGPQMTDGTSQMTDDTCQIADDKRRKTDDTCQIADNEGQKTDDTCHMANDECQMADGTCQTEEVLSESPTEAESAPEKSPERTQFCFDAKRIRTRT